MVRHVSQAHLCTRCLLAAAAVQVWPADGPVRVARGGPTARVASERGAGPAELHPVHSGTVVRPEGGGTNGQRPSHDRRTRMCGPGGAAGAGTPTGPRNRVRGLGARWSTEGPA